MRPVIFALLAARLDTARLATALVVFALFAALLATVVFALLAARLAAAPFATHLILPRFKIHCFGH